MASPICALRPAISPFLLPPRIGRLSKTIAAVTLSRQHAFFHTRPEIRVPHQPFTPTGNTHLCEKFEAGPPPSTRTSSVAPPRVATDRCTPWTTLSTKPTIPLTPLIPKIAVGTIHIEHTANARCIYTAIGRRCALPYMQKAISR